MPGRIQYHRTIWPGDVSYYTVRLSFCIVPFTVFAADDSCTGVNLVI